MASDQTECQTPAVESGDSVTVTVDAEVIEAYDDGALLVDADGTQLMVYDGEYQ